MRYALEWVVLFVVYVLVITPVALLSRLFRRDALKLARHRWGDERASAWEPRAASRPASYLRPF